MDAHKRTARLAGLYWLLSAVAGGFGLSFIRSSIIVAGDPAATAANIATSEFAYRAAIVGLLVSQVLLVFFALAIYRLFAPVHRPLAMIFLVSVVMSVVVAVANTSHHFGALHMLSQTEYLTTFTVEQRQAMAMVFLRLSGIGQGLLEIFWVPYFGAFGLLVLKSRYLPRIFGVLLLAMSAGFAVNILQKFLVPAFYPAAFTQTAMLFGALGGIPTILWLLIRGSSEDEASRIETDLAD